MAYNSKRYLFIDEGGDSSFYAKRKKLLVGTEGFQPMLNLAMVSLSDKQAIRKAIVQFMQDLKADPLYGSIYSVAQPTGICTPVMITQRSEPSFLSFSVD
jgi:hypothetical protein